MPLIEPGYGHVMAFLDRIRADGRSELRFSIELEGNQPPRFLPDGFDPEYCVQRSWYLSLKSPVAGVTADLTLEYLQEHSRRNEWGSRLDEEDIQLWAYRRDHWEQVPATNNSRSNTIHAPGVDLSGVGLIPFVACSPMPRSAP